MQPWPFLCSVIKSNKTGEIDYPFNHIAMYLEIKILYRCVCKHVNMRCVSFFEGSWNYEHHGYFRNEFDFWNIHGIIHTLHETRSIHDSMNRPKIEFIANFYIKNI